VSDEFFLHPVQNSPYERPKRYWELDEQGQPTGQLIENRRPAEFITPIPKPKKRKGAAQQQLLLLDEGKGLSSGDQQYDPTSIIIEIRR
jgi:type III restriction enzyme